MLVLCLLVLPMGSKKECYLYALEATALTAPKQRVTEQPPAQPHDLSGPLMQLGSGDSGCCPSPSQGFADVSISQHQWSPTLTSSQLSELAITNSLSSCCLQERKWWQALSALLAGQPLFSLSLCPGLVPALAEAGQYALIPLVAAQVRPLARIISGWDEQPPAFCAVKQT